MAAQSFADSARGFAGAITRNFQTRIDAQPEDQLKAPVQDLIQAAGTMLGLEVGSRTEARVHGLGARPDIGVEVRGLLTGHIELKAPGKGARPERFKGADRDQWAKFASLPNLIYTDGNEWTLQRTGQEVKRVRISGDVRSDGARSITDRDASALAELFTVFLSWQPIVPSNPKALAETLAPLCRLLRHDVLAALGDPASALSQLAGEWRVYLFPDADDDQFADAYAQTVTYALLLARFSGSTALGTEAAARTLDRGHGLLAQALRILTDHQARAEIEVPVELLERSIAAVDLATLTRRNADPWLYFYEDFLAAYDPKLRKDRGVYYTPAQVVQAQVKLVADLLVDRFDRPLTFADRDVVVLDPATGTGTYPLTAISDALRRVRERFGDGAVAGRASELAANVHAFEILIGPYAVSHLRLSQEILSAGGELPTDGAHVYLTDTLESPHAEPPGQQTLLHRPLAEEHRRAQRIKAETRVLVCIGNPPYDRQVIEPGDLATERKGGWIRFGDHPGETGILEDFLAPARAAGAGVHLKNLYNDYVYFWRWALWKVFESTGGPGIVSFITASSYLRGPGFVGMREWMRRTFDNLWIIDLEGDNLGARKTENVFAIQTPVAIAVGVRYGEPHPDEPAAVGYARIEGTREEKLEALARIGSFADLDWFECPSDWHAPFLPRTSGDYWSWPLLTDVFPWQHTGVETKRPWTIGQSDELLRRRWADLVRRPAIDRTEAYHQTRDRQANRPYPSLFADRRLDPIVTLARDACPEAIERYAFRSLDRQWVIADGRVGDFLRPSLWRARGNEQVFMTGQLVGVLGPGPAAMVAASVPDRHYFCGRGGKDVIPLWRDAAATQPNVTAGLLDRLSADLGRTVAVEDLFAYCYAVLATPRYVDRFSEELTIPGPRVPITRDAALFKRAVELGRRLIWLHTYGTRMVPPGERPGAVPQGRTRAITGIPTTPDAYPERFEYDAASRTLRVGAGTFGPVEPEVWSFSVSGLEVVKSWLSYRTKGGAGRRSSPLDEIRPERWTAELTEELLELLWVLEATVEMFPDLAASLDAIVRGPVFSAAELPTPSSAERQPPTVSGDERAAQPTLDLQG